MTMPTLIEMVDVNPRLYDALRERDSAANRVCEALEKRRSPNAEMSAWRRTNAMVKFEAREAINLFQNARNNLG